MNPIDLECKEPGCGLKVRYDRIQMSGVPGAARKRKRDSSAKQGTVSVSATFAAYLMCANDHVHRYEIPRSERKEDSDAR